MTLSEQEDLIARHFDEALDAQERERLDALLVADQDAAVLFVRYAQLHERLQHYAKDQQAAPEDVIEFPQAQQRQWLAISSIAAALLLACLFYLFSGSTTAQLSVERGDCLVDGQAVSGAMELRDGQVIETAAQSQVQLRLADGSTIRIAEHSNVEFHHNQLIKLNAAEIHCQINKRTDNNKLLIHTEHAQVTVIGTEFSVNNRKAMCAVEVDHGLVRVQTQHQQHAIELSATDSLQVSEHFLVTTAKAKSDIKYLWFNDFESGAVDKHCINGGVVPDPLMPDGNKSAYCAVAQPVNKNGNTSLLQFTLKNPEQSYFIAEEDAYVSFRYWANQECAWLGVWMASPPANHYLHYHREFVPITGRWASVRIRLSDCVRGNASDSAEHIPAGAPIYWFMIQSGNLPGAKLFIDDLHVAVSQK